MVGQRRERVVVVGAGFGGLAVVRGLRHADVDVTLIDQHNFHLFQPLLYQVASALLDPSEIAHSVRSMLRGIENARFQLGRVTRIDLERRVVVTDLGEQPYDRLVVAAGAVTNWFGQDQLERDAFALKDLAAALRLRSRVLECFERAAATRDPAERERLLNFVVVGGGPTGVEYAGALSELVHTVLRRDFPDLDTEGVRIVLVEAAPRILGAFVPRLSAAARRHLERRWVTVRTGAGVASWDGGRLRLDDGTGLPAATVVWTAGVRASPLATRLGEGGQAGRVRVLPTLQLPAHPEVRVIGDCAACAGADGAPLPMLAPVAIQQGGHAAEDIAAELADRPPRAFTYRDKGIMATVGRNMAVAQLGRVRVAGLVGWLMWLVVHLVQIISFRSRVVVLLNWAWNYAFLDRPVRLITAPGSPRAGGTDARPAADGDGAAGQAP